MEWFYHYFSFTSAGMWVEYGNPALPSYCVWFVPGTFE